MKTLVTAALCMTLLTLRFGPATAQLDPDDDGIGIYFDPCACVNCIPMEAGPQEGYIVITHPTSQMAGVGGWEAKIWPVGPATVTNVTLEGLAINVGNAPEYIVGLANPINNPFTYPAVVVATVEFTLLDESTPVNWYIDGIYFHSMDEKVPCYLDGADYSIKIALQQPTGGPGIPVATINGQCAVPADNVSWSGVKSLYR